ncbi:hypothetical protein B296_00031027, partial [Ensete ventricosum]
KRYPLELVLDLLELLDGKDELTVDVLLGFRPLGSWLRDLRFLTLVGHHLLTANALNPNAESPFLSLLGTGQQAAMATGSDTKLPPSPACLCLFIWPQVAAYWSFPSPPMVKKPRARLIKTVRRVGPEEFDGGDRLRDGDWVPCGGEAAGDI